MFQVKNSYLACSKSSLSSRNDNVLEATSEILHDRRHVLIQTVLYLNIINTCFLPHVAYSIPEQVSNNDVLKEITHPQTYSALLYTPPPPPPPPPSTSSLEKKKYPLLFVLHGAAQNEKDIWNLADIHGEHAGLPPSLISAGLAPSSLLDNFIVVAPYVGKGKRSFYEEPRNKAITFLNWMMHGDGRNTLPKHVEIDTQRICLFGFSDGATCGVELLTSRKFHAAILAAYGFTGTLPPLALERLVGIPMWVFHSADDVIFPVKCSDKLVDSLRQANAIQQTIDIIRYSRFDHDQEGFTGRVRGHSTGITASKLSETYDWLLSL